jgi:phospholipid-transporting ATPase
MIPIVSISNGVPSILLPLSFVLVTTAVKDALEDSKRKKSDFQENNTPSRRFSSEQSKFIDCKWMDLSVGDIIRVQEYLLSK